MVLRAGPYNVVVEKCFQLSVPSCGHPMETIAQREDSMRIRWIWPGWSRLQLRSEILPVPPELLSRRDYLTAPTGIQCDLFHRIPKHGFIVFNNLAIVVHARERATVGWIGRKSFPWARCDSFRSPALSIWLGLFLLL